ncbi:hypothetical protein [Gandjariella thermophila]|uniref:Uncharacterized protein n=1 Tax=Gandjariella thermophila TaxID=1931992 RepID=A0A4D4JD90_9PSEU|nr:hypothetical protein [Gandjariella thermophila]GDY32980.1 hypothetical protein GTS_46130 [Gandjariella thermophila]
MTEEGTDTLRRAADLLETLAAGSTAGRWRVGGLLATRPEIIAHQHGGTEHVAEARSSSARWIVTMQPAVAPHLAGWLRAAARGAGDEVDEHALRFARAVLSAELARGPVQAPPGAAAEGRSEARSPA